MLFLFTTKVHDKDLFSVHANGVIIYCLGMFHGSIVVNLAEHFDFLDVVMQCKSPDLQIIVGVLETVVKEHFPSCIIKHF